MMEDRITSVMLQLSNEEADELIAELDHDDNGMSRGLSPLGEKIKARIEGHRSYLNAIESGDHEQVRHADEKMRELYPDA